MLGNLSQGAKQTLTQRFPATCIVGQMKSAIAAALFWWAHRALFWYIVGDLVLILGAWVAATLYNLTKSMYKIAK